MKDYFIRDGGELIYLIRNFKEVVIVFSKISQGIANLCSISYLLLLDYEKESFGNFQ